MNREEATAKNQKEEIDLLKLMLVSTRQQLSQAMAVSAELEAKLALEKQKTAVLLDQLAEPKSDTVNTSAKR